MGREAAEEGIKYHMDKTTSTKWTVLGKEVKLPLEMTFISLILNQFSDLRINFLNDLDSRVQRIIE